MCLCHRSIMPPFKNAAGLNHRGATAAASRFWNRGRPCTASPDRTGFLPSRRPGSILVLNRTGRHLGNCSQPSS